ncbi:hypothetical protein LTS18_013017 [Coniosporium uncinatum]|uniref:Uncharacterized protein n=1 Tax=Coniosporium uncinatum TaxID=93489 RepID=A0ACC3D980_9PEZI|nr:hypothetical protein LTS18_013017 [Coniosporium uncinatum]
MESLRSALFTLQRSINRLLPFATPGTPLWQNVIHSVALLGAAYYFFEYRPQQERQRRRHTLRPNRTNEEPFEADGTDGEQQHDDARGEAAAGTEAPTLHPPTEEPNLDVQPPPHLLPPDADEHDDDFAPGPANPAPVDAHQQPPINPGAAAAASARNVGAKKAKSLARRDQRRAYHEFQRSQGEAQRQREEEEARDYEELRAEEREERKEAIRKVEEKERREREERKRKELEGREKEVGRVKDALAKVREALNEEGLVDLEEVAEGVGKRGSDGGGGGEWVEKLMRAEGMVGVKGAFVTMVTGQGWAVRVMREDVEEMYRRAEGWPVGGEGRVGLQDLGVILEEVLMGKAAA